MNDLNHKKPKRPLWNIVFRISVCLLVLAIGLWGMTRLASLKKPPAEARHAERPLKVEAVRVEAEDLPVVITAFGQVRALNVVAVAAEVAGTIIAIHPDLEVGEIIARGEKLFEVDPRNYRAIRDEARAAVGQWKSAIRRLKKQFTIDEQRLKTLERNQELVQAEFQRLETLFQQNKVGTRSGVEKAEQALNAAIDQVDQMEQALALYPIQIQEAQSALAAARARLTVADTNLKRCTVTAAFDARVKSVAIEQGQYVAPGQQALTLADDALLEIHVSVDSRDAQKWLRFNTGDDTGNRTWFSGLEPVACRVRWTEAPEGPAWQGELQRAVRFDPQTRTLTLAVRMDAANTPKAEVGGLPLVEGMFCTVEIPGNTLHHAFKLPRWAVSFDHTVFLVHEGRLKTVTVEVARIDGDVAYITGGLSSGDQVITTRLVAPLENSLLDVTDITATESTS